MEDAKAVMWLGLSFLFLVGGAGFAYLMWRAGRALRGVEKDLHRTVDEVVGVIGETSTLVSKTGTSMELMVDKAGTSMDTVNLQLQKVDVMMDSAVDMTESLDTSVRAISMLITEPVKKASAAFAGVGGAVSSFASQVQDGDWDAFDDAGSAGGDLAGHPEPAGGEHEPQEQP